MRTIHILILCLLLCFFFGHPLNAQTCGPEPVIDTAGFEGSAFFNYGGTVRSKSLTYRTIFAVGQTFIGYTENLNRNTTLGFYARYFLPPFALKVKATQGELTDGIQINWEIDALGPSPNKGFNIYKDGIFLVWVDANIRSYKDSYVNVIPGRPYTYTIRGLNIFGAGVESAAIGYMVPNGIVTGWISTVNGTAVPNATVMLEPMQGFSAKFTAGNGAMAMAEDGTTPFLPALDSNWTMTFWIKTTSSTGNASVIEMKSKSLFLRALNSASGHEGMQVTTTSGGTPFLTAQFPDVTKKQWHHVALTFDGSSHKGRLYLDGVLSAIASMNSIASPDTLNFGALTGSGTWIGRIDEFRIYHRTLDELDFDQVMEGTASSETPYLTHYWKMDEELGVKSYDLVKRHKLYFCGAVFDADRPSVHTAGISNEDGYYKIESVSYGALTPFIATPKKNFYMHRSLKFNKVENDYATVPDFSITPEATIELWVNSAGPDGAQCILSKQWGSKEFRLILNPTGLDNQIRINLNGTLHDFGLLGSGYQHLAFTFDSLSRKMVAFKNGIALDSFNFPNSVSGNWSDPTNDPWYLGKRFDGTQPFGGLIDEVAVYDKILSHAIILDHFQHSRDIQESGLRVYFQLDEGSGNKINNAGSILLTGGTTSGTDWSPMAAHQIIEPHLFSPESSQVTLSPFKPSADKVDFQDRSTIPVTGYVRYMNTDCFAQNVEILVNGTSYTPKIFTDETGKFTIDLDPGATATLTPQYEDHVFGPANWDVTNVSSPINGILFNDMTTHKITGQVTGGLCRKSIIRPSTVCILKVSSVNGCFEKKVFLVGTPDSSGVFEFNDLPPLEKMTITMEQHTENGIFTFFDALGGSTVNISKRDTVIDYIYFAQPKVLVSALPLNACGEIVLEQDDHASMDIQLVEEYYGGVCELDTGSFHIINGFSDETIDTTLSDGLLHYEFIVGVPNPTTPYKKTFEIVGTTLDGNDSEYTTQGYVIGNYAYLNTFTTTLPETPILILRDPPGDGSYAYLEKNEKICQKISFSKEVIDVAGLTGVLDLGPDIAIRFGVGAPDHEFESNFGAEITGTATLSKVEENAIEVCNSFDERISTSDNDLIVGAQGGDVYMGAALNVEFGFVAILTWDDVNCEIIHTTNVNVVPGNYATTYMYSEWNIKNSVLYNLQYLADLTTDEEQEEIYLNSIDKWNEILGENADQKAATKFEKNISFDAGVEYEYSETSDTTVTTTNISTTDLDLDVDVNLLAFIEGVGGGVIIHVGHEEITGESTDGNTEKGITTGYVLSDDDLLDAFSIDIGIDSVYKTPVFNLKAGQSSCPWEYPTAKREGVLLTCVDGPFRTDVPANEPAVFHFIMSNVSSTFETWTYAFTAGPESNPDGAKVFCNGAPMNVIQWYAIPWDSIIPVTVTVERGPVEYDYDDLEIVLYSACEDQRANDLGILPDTAAFLYSAVYVSAHFIRPCSEVRVDVPHQDWVVFPDPSTPPEVNDDLLQITVSGYDTAVTQFKEIRVQYRLSDGNGAWINIPDSVRFNPNWDGLTGNPPILTHKETYTQYVWDTDDLKDGDYEIRAVTICDDDASDKPGYSEVIKGRIDREAPSIVGLPQPSDRELQAGDEISFTFNQEINCHDFLLNPFNAKLYEKSTPNTTLGIDVTCFENKIFIVPTDPNINLENKILRADIHNVKDLTGNVFNGTVANLGKWDFYVDRSELTWLTDSMGMTKYDDESSVTKMKIQNRAGYPVEFAIQSVPNWVHVTPTAGSLDPNEIREIEFASGDTLVPGWLSESVILHPVFVNTGLYMGGNDTLPIGVRTICRPPAWEINPADFQFSMTLITQIKFNNVFSIDPEDMVAAFIEGELRGTAKLTFVPSSNTWIAFVTIYGNTADMGKLITYEIFDASACLRYPATMSGGAFNFTPNGIQGSPTVTKTLSDNGNVVYDIPLNKGWNWTSFNVGFPDSTINKALNNILNPTGDLIKDQTKFSTYNNNIWTGSLDTIGYTSMYMYQAREPNTIRTIGAPLTPASVHIPIVAGWNWISYIPTYKLNVNAALASLNKTAGDLIKSQTAFAQYVNPSAGWVGNLKTLEPTNGYLLNVNTGGTLTYPPQSYTGDEPFYSRDAESLTSFWSVNASQYEHNMTLIGLFQFDDVNATTSEMELGAFVGDEIRGVGKAVYVEFLDAYLFFMTSFANTSGEELHFKLYDGVTGDIHSLQEKMTFSPNFNLGSIAEPVPFTLQTTGIGDVQSELSFNVQPNPFREETVCRFELPEAQEVHIIVTDMDGKNLYIKPIQGNAGMNSFVWKGSSTGGTLLSNGVYFIRLETEEGILTKKVMLQR